MFSAMERGFGPKWLIWVGPRNDEKSTIKVKTLSERLQAYVAGEEAE
jgi:hypothetical protein